MSKPTRFTSLCVPPTNFTASFTADEKQSGRVLTLNAAAGLTVTLPAATGTGNHFRFFIGTTVTSNSIVIQVASSTDTMAGLAVVAQDAADTLVGWETAADTDTITFNGTTTGGILGDMVELIDVESAVWYVKILGSATGVEATPFSAAV